ncbi:MAG: immunoglobulin domain-containing protein [Verrucomicrobiota bacterium]|nr:immunoglobulin domain-containing protein [Verrucomicrobiota bacterium]
MIKAVNCHASGSDSIPNAITNTPTWSENKNLARFDVTLVYEPRNITSKPLCFGVNGWPLHNMGNFVLNWVQPTKPIFIVQPHSQAVVAGNGVIFSANAVGTPNPSYQWQLNGNNIPGAITSGYTNADVTTNDAGIYSCAASNLAGSTTSAPANLTVYPTVTPTLSLTAYTNSTFQFSVAGVPNYYYVVQANTNLTTTNWISILTNASPFTFTDPSASNYPIRFYRAFYLP